MLVDTSTTVVCPLQAHLTSDPAFIGERLTTVKTIICIIAIGKIVADRYLLPSWDIAACFFMIFLFCHVIEYIRHFRCQAVVKKGLTSFFIASLSSLGIVAKLSS